MSEYKNIFSHFERSYHFDNDAPLVLVMPRRTSGADRRRLATAVGGGGSTCAYKRPSSWVVIGVRGDRALGTSMTSQAHARSMPTRSALTPHDMGYLRPQLPV